MNRILCIEMTGPIPGGRDCTYVAMTQSELIEVIALFSGRIRDNKTDAINDAERMK